VSSCFHVRFSTSPIRAPVSLSICKSVAVIGRAEAMRVSISASVGMNGIRLSRLYMGAFHCFSM
jgi:hypothetical protein